MSKISPSIIIVLFGVIGLFFTFVDDAGLIGSKIPLTLFFIVIIVIGVWFEIYLSSQKEEELGVYGEIGNKREFS